MFKNLMGVAALAIGLQGCATLGSVQTAHTVGKGNIQAVIEPGAFVAAGGGGVGVLPTLNVAVRGGVSDKLDIGGRLGTSLYDLHFKYMFTEADAGPVLSLAPHFSYAGLSLGGASAGYTQLNVPLLIGLNTGESQLVVGPRVIMYNVSAGAEGTSSSVTAFMAGSSVGYSLKAGDTFRLHPEFTLAVPVVGIASASAEGESASAAGAGIGGVLTEIKLGFSFGGR